MADNVAITAGSGTNIATDDISGAHYQKVKIFDGTADSTNAAIVDSSGNLQVELTNTSITGTAGSANSAVLSVQGIASGTTLPTTPTLGVATSIQWSHYSNEYTSTQTSTDLVALSGSTKFYIGRLTISTGGTTAGLVTVYFGTGAYSAGTSKTVFRGNFAPAATVYPGVVIGSGVAPFCISGAGDALKITTSAAMTVYVQVDYIRV